jgi:hypothetical protein
VLQRQAEIKVSLKERNRQGTETKHEKTREYSRDASFFETREAFTLNQGIGDCSHFNLPEKLVCEFFAISRKKRNNIISMIMS